MMKMIINAGNFFLNSFQVIARLFLVKFNIKEKGEGHQFLKSNCKGLDRIFFNQEIVRI